MRVFLNAFSCACAAGLTIEETFETLLDGRSSVTYQEGYVLDRSLPLGKISSNKNFFELIYDNVALVLDKVPWLDPQKTLVLVGSSVGGICRAETLYLSEHHLKNFVIDECSISSIGQQIVEKFGFKSAISFSTACTSSSVAIDFAYDLIQNNVMESVIVIGADELSRSAVNGFDRLGIASRQHTRPFDVEREGINVAEAIAVLVLSNRKSEQCVEVMGCAITSDAYNITHPHPEGEGSRAAMRQALENANLDPSMIDYVNAHGTGTVANDEIESASIYELFGSKPFVVSTKAVTGHTLGACGALEVAIGAMSILHDVVPPCVNLVTPINKALKHPFQPTSAHINYVMSNAFGFGGGNAVIILGRADAD